MSLYRHRPIGGFFELETAKGAGLIHKNSILLNTGRNCLEYLLISNNVKKIHIPKFICDVVLEPLEKLEIEYKYYEINEQLEIQDSLDVSNDEYILYVNYFGLKDEYCNKLISEQENIILDCSQAYYFSSKENLNVFYSPRKFFGVPDGGQLYSKKILKDNFDKDISYKRINYLAKRTDLGAEKAYEDFKSNEESLNNQPIREMSSSTRKLLESIDYDEVKQKRVDNFMYLHKKLSSINKLSSVIKSFSSPLTYPYYTEDAALRQKLIEERIYTPIYWPNVLGTVESNSLSQLMAKNLIHLPIDQRYNQNDMNIILRVLSGENEQK